MAAIYRDILLLLISATVIYTIHLYIEEKEANP